MQTHKKVIKIEIETGLDTLEELKDLRNHILLTLRNERINITHIEMEDKCQTKLLK